MTTKTAMRVFFPALGLGVVLVGIAARQRAESKPAEPVAVGTLRLVTTYALDITEPSGLAINDSGTVLWTVTNNPDKVYQLDTAGKVVRTLHYVGEDLEGIAYDRSDRDRKSVV